MDFAGNALAPNVLTLKSQLAKLSADCKREYGRRLDYQFPLRGDKSRPLTILGEDESGKPIDLQAGFGLGPFLDPNIREQVFSESGGFQSIYPQELAQSFVDAGMVGGSAFTIYSVSPFVMLVDCRALGNRPMPASWADLLDPIYREQIIITPEELTGNIALLSFLSMFGEDGLRAFVENIAFTASASVMAMLPDKPRSVVGSIYVIPWFFARVRSMHPNEVSVWPAEGALSFPLWLAMHSGASDCARLVASYFTGAAFAKESAGLCLPTVNAASDIVLAPENRRYSWVGWDFLKTPDLEFRNELLAEVAGGIKGVDEL